MNNELTELCDVVNNRMVDDQQTIDKLMPSEARESRSASPSIPSRSETRSRSRKSSSHSKTRSVTPEDSKNVKESKREDKRSWRHSVP